MKDEKAGRGTSAAAAKAKAVPVRAGDAKEANKAKPVAKATPGRNGAGAPSTPGARADAPAPKPAAPAQTGPARQAQAASPKQPVARRDEPAAAGRVRETGYPAASNPMLSAAEFLMTGGIIPTPTAAFSRMETALEAGAEQARIAYSRVQDTSDNIRDAFSQSATTAARGVVEINGKVLDLLRTQSEAAFIVWRSVVGASSLPDAMYAQARAVRDVCEATTAQWQDIAETAGRVAGEAMKPLRSAWSGHAP